MSNAIILPPLPARIITMYVEGERGTYPIYKAIYKAIYKDGYTADELRARDLEVVRLVLEGAANVATENREPWTASGIRNIEVKHHE